MPVHPLKILTLLSISILIGSQIALIFWLQNDYRFLIALVLMTPLLLPLKGLFSDRRYTYKWTGFLTMLYFSIGISESFANSDLRLYGVLNILFSCLLFVGSIYYSRYLRYLENSTST